MPATVETEGDTTRPIASANGAEVYHLDWRALASVVEARGGCDLLAVDAPYSERTHAGHDSGAEDSNGTVDRPDVRDNRLRYAAGLPAMRRHISYGHFTPADVRAFVAAWAPLTRGWMVSITDHVLAPVWSEAMEAAGRYTFSPLAYVAPGSRVRLSGDGPAQWSCWIVVSRPRARAFAGWGALPGAYVIPPGEGGAMPVVGGKPAWLMERLVQDYTRPGDLVVDPCAGAGTTLVAAIRHGRRAIGGDIDAAHARLAATWIANPHRRAPGIERAPDARQPALFEAAP